MPNSQTAGRPATRCIGFIQRLVPAGTVRLPAIMMLTLEPESLKNQLATTRHQTKITSDRLPDCTRCILRYFLNKSFSVTRWPVSNVDVVDSVICCPSAETSHLSV
jgi:hypothetical protein